jgi:mRNA interferase MazF
MAGHGGPKDGVASARLYPAVTKTSERFDAFDVVVVPFPYADRLAEKRRPALVISNRRLAPFGLIWVAMITSADNAPLSCDVTIANLARAGLPAPSVVRAAKIACIEPAADRAPRRTARRGNRKSRGSKAKGIFGERVRAVGAHEGRRPAPYSPHAANASLKARSPGAPFSIAMMARRWLE